MRHALHPDPQRQTVLLQEVRKGRQPQRQARPTPDCGQRSGKRIHESRKGRVRGLSDALYETPPTYRAEYLQRLIAMARRNAELRRLVTNREMLRSWMRDEGTGRLHIAHVLDHYCREVYGQRSFEVVNPATELPGSDELVFPAEYFGPDAPPIYKDGGLNVRPCPWKARKAETAKSPSTTIKRT